MPTVMVAGALGIFAYVAGNAVYSKYLLLPYIPGAGELTVFCGALAGAGLGFLWFNAYPAEVFMGDVGALALGAALGTVAVIVRQEIVLFIMGGVFVVETLSVMLQVLYFKWSGGKRIFRMAPLHHHYELSGWKETQVVVRFWIITMMLVLFGLSTLKLEMNLAGKTRAWSWVWAKPGLSMARFLARRGARVRVADTRDDPPGARGARRESAAGGVGPRRLSRRVLCRHRSHRHQPGRAAGDAAGARRRRARHPGARRYRTVRAGAARRAAARANRRRRRCWPSPAPTARPR